MTGTSPDEPDTPDAVAKQTLVDYLQTARDAVVWKLEGLSDYDVRRPMTPTGTNLLGLVKHLASIEAGYFGDTFGRPWPEPLPWFEEDAPVNDDMYAFADESREEIVGLYRRVWAHAAETFAVTDLHAPGRVPWWPPEREVTLHRILVHVATETNRHAGHADIVRETIDSQVGLRREWSNLPDDGYDWPAYVAKVEQAARVASGRTVES
jgi:uncharacterized damage-inducible protein DinB